MISLVPCGIGDVLLLLRVCLQGILRWWPSALRVNLRVLLHVGTNQDTWTPEPSLWTMTWRVHNVTSRNSQVFDTFEGLLQIHNMPEDAVPQLTDETAQAGFSHACSVPTRDGEGRVIPPSSRLLILALSQAVFRRRHPLFLVGDGFLNLSQLMPLSRALCPVQTRRFQIRRRLRRHQFPKNVQLSFFQFLAILLLTTTVHVLGQLRPQKVQFLGLQLGDVSFQPVQTAGFLRRPCRLSLNVVREVLGLRTSLD